MYLLATSPNNATRLFVIKVSIKFVVAALAFLNTEVNTAFLSADLTIGFTKTAFNSLLSAIAFAICFISVLTASATLLSVAKLSTAFA